MMEKYTLRFVEVTAKSTDNRDAKQGYKNESIIKLG